MPEPADVGDRTRSTGSGLGRVLVFVYGIFAAAATARSVVQLATKASEAPLAYTLSAFAGVVYCLATWAIAKNRRRLALATVLVELVGVVVVGAWSVLAPGDFPDQTVWSDFGQGYGYVPAALPFVGLWWLLSRPAGSRR
jgi:cytochrome bd-type quinol oxidase subunit 2